MAIIFAIPSTINWSSLTEESSKITVLSSQGGVYTNTDITADCTFNYFGNSSSGIVVDTNNGIIYMSASSISIDEMIVVACTYAGEIVDYVCINISSYSLIFYSDTNSMYIPQL